MKCRVKAQILKFLVLSFAFAFYLLRFALICFAQEITILYTGETHAMLYPCNCPKEPDGGVARRATLIKQLKKNNPDSLILDSGGFFAGGLMDTYTQNVELDMHRTLINLRAIGLIGYDALGIGDDEFNFGKDFLLENIAKSNLTFLSCNISAHLPKEESLPFKPYIMKELAGIKIGIMGVTTVSAQDKAGGFEFTEPKAAVKNSVDELRKNNADIIILLSHLGETEDLNLIKELPGIDILFIGHNRDKTEPSSKINSTIMIRPSWQGRHLGKLWLRIKDKKIIDYKVEELRLSDLIIDDPQILSILPACFSDVNCHKAGLSGKCQNPATLNAQCQWEKIKKIGLTVILPEDCTACDNEKIISNLKAVMPGIEASYLYYPGRDASRLVKKLDISTLPAYILRKEAEKEEGFEQLRDNTDKKGDYYKLKPTFTGISYFLNRKSNKGQLDILLSLFAKGSLELLEAVRDFKPKIHFLAAESEGGAFTTLYGNAELEEYLRCVCIDKYYPGYFWDYLSCRAKNILSSWWQDCLPSDKIDAKGIERCAKSEEGRDLLRNNIQLNKELKILYGPIYLLNNCEIFSSVNPPNKEELRKIINRR